jgi:hypothetical protein
MLKAKGPEHERGEARVVMAHVALNLIAEAMHVRTRGIDEQIGPGSEVFKQFVLPGEGVGEEQALGCQGVGTAGFPEAAMERGRFRVEVDDLNLEAGVRFAQQRQARGNALEFAGKAARIDGNGEISRALLCLCLPEERF